MSVAIPVYVREDINADMRRIVEASGVSISQFINDAIEARLEAIKAEEWRKGLEAMADDPEAILWDVEAASCADTEVFLVEYEK